MPYVHVKLVGSQVSQEQKQKVIEGLTDLIVNIMGRDKNTTVITLDELSDSQWALGGKTPGQFPEEIKKLSFVNIKVSKGTTNPDEMSRMMQEVKKLFSSILGNCEEANYFIIDELNPDAWGFDGISMTERRKMK